MSNSSVSALGPGARLVPARDVYLALYEGAVVVLDAGKDEYSALGLAVSNAVRWSLCPASMPEPSGAGTLLDPLVRRGLLVPAPHNAVCHLGPEPTESGGLTSYAWSPHVSRAALSDERSTIAQSVRALWYVAHAAAVVRRGRMLAVLAWLRRRYAVRAGKRPRPDSSWVAASLVQAHIRARMLYFRQIHCLAGSAALAAHAWAVRVPVVFMIGVQRYPFAAHAWVELDGQVLNDRPEVSRRLAPIVWVGRGREC